MNDAPLLCFLIYWEACACICTILLGKLGKLHIGGSEFAAVFGISFDIKSDPLTFGQGFEAIAGDAGKMDENIVAAIIIRDKTKALCFVEPFYCTFIH